jgi:hypothetical protein
MFLVHVAFVEIAAVYAGSHPEDQLYPSQLGASSHLATQAVEL